MFKTFVTLSLTLIAFLPGVCRQSERNLDYIPPSPTASNFLKYGEIPVDHYSGIPKIEVPLFTVKEKSLQIPVSLKYHGGGVKVNDMPSAVGLGWVLSAGGMITREVRDHFDEQHTVGYINYDSHWGGMFSPNHESLNSLTTQFASNSDASTYFYNCFSVGGANVDTAPDNFTIILGDRIEKFMFDTNGNTISDSKLKIEYVLDYGEWYDVLSQWKVTAEDGTQYFFEELEWTVTMAGFAPTDAITAWYLTKVISADGLSQINLEYEDSPTGTVSLGQNFINVTEAETVGGYSLEEYGHNYTHGAKETQVHARLISKISTTNYDLEFENGWSEDALGSLMDNRLYGIKILDKTSHEVRRFKLTYEALDNFRFLLKGIQEQVVVGEVMGQPVIESKPPYLFEYDMTPIGDGFDVSCFDGCTSGMDIFGYYNGPKPEYNSRIMDNDVNELELNNANMVKNSDRTPNASYVQAGTLLKITYPTGGETTFEYEPNDYSYVSNVSVKSSKVVMGGIRLKKITNFDGVDAVNKVVKTFTYESPYNSALSSGVVLNEPQLFFDYDAPETDVLPAFSMRIWETSSIKPINFGYSQVIEHLNDGSMTVYRYLTSYEHPYLPFADDKRIEIHYVSPDQRFRLSDHPFLFGEGRLSFMRGRLKEKLIYNSEGNLLQSERNYYEPYETSSLYATHYQYFPSLGTPLIFVKVPTELIFWHRYSINIGRANLVKKEVRSYYNDVHELLITRNYSYTNFGEVSMITESTSSGRELVKIFKYPFDFGEIQTSSTGAAKGIRSLQSKHVLNSVIEEYSYLQNANQTNKQVISGKVYVYDASLPFLKEVHKLELPSPLAIDLFSPSTISGSLTFVKDSKYQKLMQFDAYDLSGNVAQYGLTDEIKMAYLWGYNGNFPVAEIKNATSSKVRLSSFEENYPYSNQLSFTAPTSSTESKTGKRSLILNNSNTGVTIQGLTVDGQSYKLSFWLKGNGNSFRITNGNSQDHLITKSGWFLFEMTLSPQSSTINIRGLSGSNVFLDELRFYPIDAQVTTYTYDPLFGQTDLMDHNGKVQKFEYDPLGRLKLILDEDGSILKQFKYAYKY